MALLNTVRAKLTTLVGLSAVATLASLPLLHWVMSRQLVDVVDDRVPDSVHGFEIELADDIRDLEAATRSLAESEELVVAIKKSDVAAANDELRVFHETYAGTSFIAFTAEGVPFATVGIKKYDVSNGVPGRAALDKGDATGIARVILPKGCEVLTDPKPSYALARPIRGGGYVVGCMAIDEGYLANSSEKLGVEVALVDEIGTPTIRTPKFPMAAVAVWKPGEALVDDDVGKAWALAKFEPAPLAAVPNHFKVIVALDMTRIRDVVRQNLALTVAVLVIAAGAAIIMGARLANMMSRALSRLNVALKKLEKEEYVHVTGVKTGDEIEDLASGFNSMVDGLRERDKLRLTFGKYMTQSVMEHLMRGDVQLGGESLTVTILFSDIRSFTSISETMTAQELVKLLNEYFTEMVAVVMAEGGVVDKYIGDAIMAVFGAPVSKKDDALRAVRAAIGMREALAKLNVRLVKRGAPPIRTGVGLHTGEVVAGNIGSELRMEYTVIGDAVNLASRLESATKELGTDVLISEDTQALIGDEIETRAVKEITVKGRVKPVVVYEVIGYTKDKEKNAKERAAAAAAAKAPTAELS